MTPRALFVRIKGLPYESNTVQAFVELETPREPTPEEIEAALLEREEFHRQRGN